MRRKKLLLIALVPFLVGGSSTAQPWSGILSSSRAINWTQAGVTGGIPNRITVCASLTPSNTLAQINNAIAACPSGQIVSLAAGTYHLAGGIVFKSKNNVTLRGAGANQTFLVFTGSDVCQGYSGDICVESSDVNWDGGPSNRANWTTGYSAGSTVITLASVPNLVVGNPIILAQADDATDNGSVLVCSQTTGNPVCSLDGGGSAEQNQVVTVTACGNVTTVGAACSGTNVKVSISPGLYMSNWASSKSPYAWWASYPISGVGIENMSLDHTNSTQVGIVMVNASNSWVEGVRSIDSAQAHVRLLYSAHMTVRDSYMFLTHNSVDVSYGVECNVASDSLVENNILQAVSTPLMINGSCSGTVLGYNYTIDNYYSGSPGWSQPGSYVHHGGTDHVLYEGNATNMINADVFHGTHNLITVFRNYVPGNQPVCYASGSTYATSTFAACNNNLIPLRLDSFSRFFNIVGNVLGQSGTATGYTNSGNFPIYLLGNGNSANGVTVPNDPNVQRTIMRWGNYDVVSKAVRWCGNASDPGWSTTCSSTSEVPSSLTGTQAPYSNPVPSSTTLPASFYYSSKPGWWPSSKAWPPIGPDVNGGNISGVSGHAYTIPAQDCYTNVMAGPSTGTGPVLTFNARTCYAQHAGPAPPTNLTAVSQ